MTTQLSGGRRSRRARLPLLAMLVALVALFAAACGSDDDTEATSDATAPAAAAGASAAAVDLTGVTLHVGDQYNILKSQLEAAGVLDDAPYKVEWSQFQGGPAVIAAETGGDVDLGMMGETPVVFAQAANSPVKVVGVSKISDPAKYNFALIVKNDSPIRTIADLKGKKILNSQGTVSQYLIGRVLEKAGLTTKDVELVNIQQGAQAAYDRGDVDVSGSGGAPLVTTLAKGQDRVLISGSGLLPGFNYLVARDGALSDPKTSAALGDFLGRVAKSQDWYNANPDKAAEIVKPIYKVDDAIARKIVTLAPFKYVPIDSTIIDAHQSEADFFTEQGVLKSTVDATKVFDDRYNPIVTKATSGS
ncbi:ABC transporter substrate-binding protein [Parafrankia sp. EUN1f]|uniref:ABC transporter substrate-binding protein n=1 Tax=Parafrankia sp. EUN1f TaxID=102897 RepID=UPI001E3D80F2|nr:ABC transporter substrate-binding protein [Parafrankia sp. EUN1f]